MSKYISKSARKRIPMTSKMGNKNFYKGKGATKEGKINSRGKCGVLSYHTDSLWRLRPVCLLVDYV